MTSDCSNTNQRKIGPAPIASFEDLSDEVENASEILTSEIKEEMTIPVVPSSLLKTSSTPRIDISRASSSSHQEDDSNSRESSPDREFFTSTEAPEDSTLQLGYKESAQDLRSSTEELDLQDPVHEQDQNRISKRIYKYSKQIHDNTQSEYGSTIKIQNDRERKDSNCSEITLLNISGRTSRVSSVGSQGSAGGLSIVSAVSSRSPSPHKCLLETSFCGSISNLANTLIEPSKPETDDLAIVLLQREEDSTKAMIPEDVRVAIIDGNLKADPLDMPKRRGREERKEIFKREVEITKKVLKKVNIEVPVIKLFNESENELNKFEKSKAQEINSTRKMSLGTSPSLTRTSSLCSSTASDAFKFLRQQKIRNNDGSRTPSPSSISRKCSFSSLFKNQKDGTNIQCQDSPTISSRCSNLANKLKESAENLRRSKSREHLSSNEKAPGNKEFELRSRAGSDILSSTLNLFKKHERKKSGDHDTSTPSKLEGSRNNLDNIECVDFTCEQQNTLKNLNRKEDVIFISLYGENDQFKTQEQTSITSEQPMTTLKNPPKLIDEYNIINSKQNQNIICTDVTIEHRQKPKKSERRNVERTKVLFSMNDSIENNSIDSKIKKNKNSKILSDDNIHNTELLSYQKCTENREDDTNQTMSESLLKESICEKCDIMKHDNRDKNQTYTSEEKQEPQNLKISSEIKTNNDKDLKFTSTKGKAMDKLILSKYPLTKTPSIDSDLDRNSSESEHDSEIDFIRNKMEKGINELPDERKGLCYEESFEDELPYVPTTLPLEKSVAIPILPIKQRLQDLSTTPIERPRSTTPINPTRLDEFIMHTTQEDQQSHLDKMKISLPREDSFKLKSSYKLFGHNSFNEFAGRVSISGRSSSLKNSSSPLPLPSHTSSIIQKTASKISGGRPDNWVNFEEIPEKRKAPKRIQIIPRLEENLRRHSQSGTEYANQYTYVQDECHCECHEESKRIPLHRGVSESREYTMRCKSMNQNSNNAGNSGIGICNGDNCSAFADRTRIPSNNSTVVHSLNLEYKSEERVQNHANDNVGIKPFAMDLDISSNRSSLISSEETEEEHQ